jgi:hypothetical protein
MASRCSTALVEPPTAMMTTIAFSNAARVMMSRGLMSRSSKVENRLAGSQALADLVGVSRRGIELL